jgi:hypothetical protein
MSSRHIDHNVYAALHRHNTTALSDTVPLDKAKLPHSAVVLLLCLQRHQKRVGKYHFDVHSGDLLYETGLSGKTLTDMRDALVAQRFITAEETGKKGIWTYEICNPRTGKSLPNPRERVEFANVPDDVATAFYTELKMLPGYVCPLCKRTGVLTLKLDRGNEKHGHWSCSKCEAHGGFIKALMRVYGIRVWSTGTLQANVLLKEIADGLANPMEPAPAYKLPAHLAAMVQHPEPDEVISEFLRG